MLDSTFSLAQNTLQTFVNVAAPKLLFRVPPLPQCKVSVAIPVRNEAANLDLTLKALVEQIDLDGRKFDSRRYEILVLANNCTDDSAALVRSWQLKSSLPIHLAEIELPAAEANCGRARQTVMNAAFARLKNLNNQRAIIATTDGDTRVAPDWIAATITEINLGADAVSGRIMIDPQELAGLDKTARRFHLQDVYYRYLTAELESYLAPLEFDPRPRHHQHFNASFAVTIEAFKRAGGVPKVAYLEDFAFYQSLLRVDARFRHSPQVRVFTSARRDGRTARGLSTQLAEWVKMGEVGESCFVEDLSELEMRFASFYELRQMWQRARGGESLKAETINRLAEQLGVCNLWLTTEICAATTFGQLRETTEQAQRDNGFWRTRYSFVSIETAIKNLRLRLAQLRRHN